MGDPVRTYWYKTHQIIDLALLSSLIRLANQWSGCCSAPDYRVKKSSSAWDAYEVECPLLVLRVREQVVNDVLDYMTHKTFRCSFFERVTDQR